METDSYKLTGQVAMWQGVLTMMPFNLIPHFVLERLSAGERNGRFAAAALADHFLI